MHVNIQSGRLYVVATPIGNLSDLSPRAQSILAEVDCIAAEDTRHTRQLLQHFQINTRLVALHEHNEAEKAAELLTHVQEGGSLALVSDAGTPLISDPGFHLLKLAHEKEIPVRAVPGPCAAIAALSVAGIASDRFCFEGFLPAKASARAHKLAALLKEERTLVFYEAPHRILESLKAMQDTFGGERVAVLVKEITKTFETVKQGAFPQLIEWLMEDPVRTKGEFVIIIAGALTETQTLLSESQRECLSELLEHLSCKQAVQIVAKLSGINKNSVYATALELSKET